MLKIIIGYLAALIGGFWFLFLAVATAFCPSVWAGKESTDGRKPNRYCLACHGWHLPWNYKKEN